MAAGDEATPCMPIEAAWMPMGIMLLTEPRPDGAEIGAPRDTCAPVAEEEEGGTDDDDDTAETEG